ncbi:leptomycin B resistance protein pmd1 [Dothidotthia symphoricarpi CBS 119687]|uniref:Leptomycin B resistance protein pmd1 n=1 Tax=Dothidotthia symphoricarpi CBS 119687 TaxID=1392245 RepID=A0A6A6AEL6_9PLEO|nr:leptomycin B resistance protein pmd1 [Dothidotthia symphoricarpi CBS 119687]KAF2130329.1 leptomycin B resistance protein pmd1 [Dothidotthia symphoricarpi CBS 119687]
MHLTRPSRASIKPFFGFIHLLFYADPTWLDVVLVCVGCVAAIAAGVPFPIVAIVFGKLVDDFNDATCNQDSGGSTKSIDSQILLLVYLAIASLVLIYVHLVCWSIASQRLAQRVRDRYLRNLLRQDLAFFDNLQAGEVSSRLNGDIQAIESGTCEKVGVALACVSFCVTAYIVGFTRDAELTGILISLIPAFLLMAVIGGHFFGKYTAKLSACFGSASAIASESLSHIGLVHALGANTRLEEKFRAHLGDAREAGIKKANTAAVQAGLLYFIAFSASALGYWRGSRKIADAIEGNGNTTIGQIYTVTFILLDGAIVLSQVAPLLPLFGGAVAAFKRLQKDIETQPTINNISASSESPSMVDGSIEFRKVAFTYPSRPDQPVLNSISFDCEAGKLTAIVGLSGSGKSTIASLISRFYDPQSGNVWLDGHDVKDLNVRTLRGFISLVQQEPSLLDRSILENVALGLINSPAHSHLEKTLLSDTLAQLTEEARNGHDLIESAKKAGPEVAEIIHLVQHAADLADVATFIDRLEFGFATLVGSSGSLVSGGQKQRIALARALVRDPKILILDEATAALDSASEQRIQAAIERASQGRTVVSIAHRLSTIRNASKIIVMKKGTILEQGTHEQLMSQAGSYADMVHLQSVKPTGDGTSSSRTSLSESEISVVPNEKQVFDPKESDAVLGGDANSPDSASTTKEQVVARSTRKTMAPLVRPYILLLALAFFAALIVGGQYIASSLLFGNIMGGMSPCNEPNYIRSRGELLSGMWFMVACVVFFANFTSWSVFGLVSERLVYKVRNLSLQALLHQPLQWHESEGRSPSSLLEFITKDGNALAGFSGSIAGTLFSVIVNFVGAIILSHIIAWRIAIVCLVTVPILLGAGFMQFRAIGRFAAKHASAFSSSIGVTIEAVANIRTVHALSIEDEIVQTYRRSLEGPRKEMVKQSLKTNVWLAIANSCGFFIYALAYWWGYRNVSEGRYKQTEFFIILIAMLVSAQLWGQLFTLAPEISKAKGAISRICGLIELGGDSSGIPSGRSSPASGYNADEKRDIEALGESASPASPGGGGAQVVFRDVSFSYPARPGIPVLTSLSLSIQPGQFCALVGPSGAGKSTVLALLERFYRPTSGSIFINGYDISHHHGVSFRDDIAYVPQANVLFQGSIKFNISLGARPGHTPTDEEIQEACKLANIHETIVDLPQGYETDCGANGSQLSGGQKQRLSIARALVRKPKLLLLDESTSALDAESEKALELGLERAVKGHGVTVIAIAHRLRTIARADVIFMVDGGKVVDQGRHEDLVQRSESYRVNALHQMVE